MLVLTRHIDEGIVIGDSVVVTVLGIEGDRVKIGISAPRDVNILRLEVFEAVKEQTALQARLADSPEPESFNQLRQLLQSSSAEEGAENPAARPPENQQPSEETLGQ